MQPNSATTTSSNIVDVASPSGGTTARGLLVGLIPVALLLGIAVLTLVANWVAGLATAGQGFATQQQIAVIVVGVGLAIAVIVYTIFCVRTLRRVRTWQRAGDSAIAAGALWGLSIGALIVVLPLILGVVLPQHPAASRTTAALTADEPGRPCSPWYDAMPVRAWNSRLRAAHWLPLGEPHLPADCTQSGL